MSRQTQRRVLLLAHPSRPDMAEFIRDVAERLAAAGVSPRLPASDAAELQQQRQGQGEAQRQRQGHGLGPVHIVDDAGAGDGCELVLVLGGDGTILRGAEAARGTDTPLLGINLGKVGFLAEAERADLPRTIEAIVARDYQVEERMTLDVTVSHGGRVDARTWALNEVSIEKAARERMLEVAVEVDGRPLSTWACDGVIVATPTGSTAYAFSAGGPVVWPDVEAILLVPNSAHALFARPVVVGPGSHLAVEVIRDAEGAGVVWCDGRRQFHLTPGARIDVCRSPRPMRLARLTDSPFTDRLVTKFDLQVAGWRGNDSTARSPSGQAGAAKGGWGNGPTPAPHP
ncbi:MAG: NAD kinase [Actinomycetales bacterium]|nr:MAG: NAD kinase [Actinomycetales bacterium]